MNLEQILESIDKEILTDETKSQLKEAFDAAVETRASERLEERVSLAVDTALEEQDADHAEKLQRFVTSIDEDHTDKLNRCVEIIEANHLGKLKQVVRKFEGELDSKASSEMEQLTDQISTYLDKYLDEAIPSDIVHEAARNIHSRKIVENARDILAIDENFARSKVREAVQDGARQIEELKEENQKLKKRVVVDHSKKLLDEMTSNMPNSKANFIRKRLGGRPPRFIQENFKYVEELWHEKAQSDSKINASHTIPTVDRQSNATGGEIVTEQSDFETENVDPNMDTYMEGLTNRDRY